MRRNWPFFKDSDWLILVFVHSAKPTAELENLAMSPSLSSPGLSYDTKFVHIGWELRSSLVGDTILDVQSEPACMFVFVNHSLRHVCHAIFGKVGTEAWTTLHYSAVVANRRRT